MSNSSAMRARATRPRRCRRSHHARRGRGHRCADARDPDAGGQRRHRRQAPSSYDPSWSAPPLILARSVSDGELMLSLPDEAGQPCLLGEATSRGCREILWVRRAGSRFQLDDVTSVWPEVDDAMDRALGRTFVRPGGLIGLREPDRSGGCKGALAADDRPGRRRGKKVEVQRTRRQNGVAGARRPPPASHLLDSPR